MTVDEVLGWFDTGQVRPPAALLDLCTRLMNEVGETPVIIDHVALLVGDLARTASIAAARLGVAPESPHLLADHGVEALLLPHPAARLELLRPLQDEGPLARRLAVTGDAFHHLALRVENVDRALAHATRAGRACVDQIGREGLTGRVGFLHPASTEGILIEFVSPRGRSTR